VHHLQPREDIGFAPVGLDEPYRIVVGNNPVNFVDPLGLINWKRTLKGVGLLTGGIVGISIAATAEIGSGGLATALAVGGAIGSATALSHGVSEIILGIGDKENAILSPHPISIGTYACTKDFDKAENAMFYYQVATFSKIPMGLLYKTPSNYELMKIATDGFGMQFDAYEYFERYTRKSR